MYSSKISINKNFQTSINLELDLGNKKKINEYIPTADICDVLKRYTKACLYSSNERATTLVGPYGKGKSFLLLILAYLMGKKKKDETYNTLLDKIKSVDKELFDLLKDFDKRKMVLMPVIVNSNYDNLNQAFMLALNDALKFNEIENVIPNTVFSVCLDLIKKWEKDNRFKNEVIKECEKQTKTDLKELKKGLKEYSVESYESFIRIYNCVTNGIEFNPLVNNDIVAIYNDVNNDICKRGYKGLFIIFDEFSKLIESSSDSLMRNLKIIQDFAELASRSDNERQIHLCCVTHKSMDLYAKNNSKVDSFKTVEGRFKEIKFNRSLEENYQIISAAIKKDDSYNNAIKKYINSNRDFYSRIQEATPFNKETNFESLFYGCFPLNPMTVYSVIHLSEIIAQNERTLFTFICDTDDNSLNSFIRTNDMKNGLFNVDKVYDYFSDLLQKEETNSMRSIWYRTEGTLSHIEEQVEKRVTKALSIILMLNDNDRFPATVENISLCTQIDKDIVESTVNDLIDRHYIRKNVINNLISFASTNSKEIEERINLLIKTKLNSLSINEIAEEIYEAKYILPRKYNEINKISRFYRHVFIRDEELLLLNSFDVLFDKMFSDGLLINVIRNKCSIKKIEEKVKEINNPRVIVRCPKTMVDAYLAQEIMRYAALKEIIVHGGNDQVVTEELVLLQDETADDIRQLMDSYFNNNCKLISSISEATSLNAMLTEVMEKVYLKRIVFNNELVNKNTVTTQYQKSINNVIEWMLNAENDEMWSYSETSPENTVRVSVVDRIDEQKDVRSVVDEIKESIINSEKDKKDISLLVSKYSSPPYGIRKGILPLLIAKSISELSDNVILFLKDKEIELNADNIYKSVISNGSYYFGFARGSKNQSEYLYKMLALFNAKPVNNFRTDLKTLTNEFRKFFVGLPLILRMSNSNNNVLNVNEKILEFKDRFLTYDINPFETVLVAPLDIFGYKNYTKIVGELGDFISNWKECLNVYKTDVSQIIRDCFQIDEESSIKMGIESYIKNVADGKMPVLNGKNNNILNTINNITFDDIDATNSIVQSCVGSYIEDWNCDKKEEFKTVLLEFIDSLSTSKRVDINKTSINQILADGKNIEISDLAVLMKNNIESIIDEYGNSVSSEEKIFILANMLKDIL